ncbi:hypothetical protein NBRC116592_36050 [Colwellia sp. KU-HH00111]
MLCRVCNHNNSLWKRFSLNFDRDVYLACDKCGGELINKDAMSIHIIITTGIFGFFMVAKTFYDISEIYNFILIVIVPSLYFYLFLPQQKKH